MLTTDEDNRHPTHTEATMVTLDTYTGDWQEALRPEAPEIGTEIRIPDSHSPDGRELDDVLRVLRQAELSLVWDRAEDEDGDEWSIWTVEIVDRHEYDEPEYG